MLFHTPAERDTYAATRSLRGAVGCTHMFITHAHTHAPLQRQTYVHSAGFLGGRAGVERAQGEAGGDETQQVTGIRRNRERERRKERGSDDLMQVVMSWKQQVEAAPLLLLRCCFICSASLSASANSNCCGCDADGGFTWLLSGFTVSLLEFHPATPDS